MARKPRPWFRKGEDAWFVTLNGKQINLGKNKKEADQEFYRLMANSQTTIRSDSLVTIFDLFLDWTKRNRAEGTYDWHLARLSEFGNTVKTLRVMDLKPLHVQAWIDTKNSDGHKRGCIISVTRALNWAKKQGYIDRNPIGGMEKPAAGRREYVIPEKEYDKMIERCSDQELRDVLTFAWETGARPQEIYAAEARHVRDQCLVFPRKEAKGKKSIRTIYLTEKAEEIIKRLAAKYPKGKLFRNADGDAWNRNNIACRFGRMEKWIGRKACLYDFRHTFCTRKLEAGLDSVVVAALMGHRDLSMLGRVYFHASQNPQHLLDQLKRA